MNVSDDIIKVLERLESFDVQFRYAICPLTDFHVVEYESSIENISKREEFFKIINTSIEEWEAEYDIDVIFLKDSKLFDMSDVKYNSIEEYPESIFASFTEKFNSFIDELYSLLREEKSSIKRELNIIDIIQTKNESSSTIINNKKNSGNCLMFELKGDFNDSFYSNTKNYSKITLDNNYHYNQTTKDIQINPKFNLAA